MTNNINKSNETPLLTKEGLGVVSSEKLGVVSSSDTWNFSDSNISYSNEIIQ
jgi:hypothetical protein